MRIHSKLNNPNNKKHQRKSRNKLLQHFKIPAINKGPAIRQGTPGSAGYDLHSMGYYSINPGDRSLINTGLSLAMPLGMYGRIAPRSGLSANYGIEIGAGVIDSDFTGEIKVLLYNFGEKTFEVQPGDRIAQILFGKYISLSFENVETLPQTARNTSSFGSTGIHLTD